MEKESRKVKSEMCTVSNHSPHTGIATDRMPTELRACRGTEMRIVNDAHYNDSLETLGGGSGRGRFS